MIFPYSKSNIVILPIWLAPNPEHHPEGDFHLSENGQLSTIGTPSYTYSGIGLFRPDLFKNTSPSKKKLAPLLKQAMAMNRVSGELYDGFWMDIGTPQRLIDLENHYKYTTD